MTALIIAAHAHGQLDANTARLVSAARLLADEVHILVLGSDPAALAAQAASIAGVGTVLMAAAPHLDDPLAETLASQVLALIPAYRFILAQHNTLGRATLPRLAALCDGAFFADVIAVEAQELFVRPMYAGSVIAKVQPLGVGKVLCTVRSTAFAAAGVASCACPVVAVAAVAAYPKSRLLGRDAVSDSRPDLTRSRLVVGVGRGIGALTHMPLVEAFADQIGAALGASRAAVDAGFASNAIQIGQTGKTVAPDVYLAFGISGAIQHLAGIKDAKVIVAVNKDADAPIFALADYGLVGDLFEVLPRLCTALSGLETAG
jgi:electron transfer flavoprotein alpha subunit